QSLLRRWRDGQEAVNTHGLCVTDVGVIHLNFLYAFTKGTNRTAFGKAAQTVIAGTGAYLYAGVLGVHIVFPAAALRAATLEAGNLRHDRLTNRLFKEVLGLRRVFQFTKQFDVTVRRNG